MQKLVIDRKTWLHGETSGSRLFRLNDGKMCCLGFYALQCLGVNRRQIFDEYSPGRTPHLPWPESLLYRTEEGHNINTSACVQLMIDNDSNIMSDSEREAIITKEFFQIGVEVEFIGEY